MRGGGHLVLGQRSAMKNEDNSLWPQRQPGPLAALLGARVAQWYALDTTVPLSGTWGSGEDKVWAEQIEVQSPETQVLMRYGKSNGWLDGQPAAVTRKAGKGSITYVGAQLEGTVGEARCEVDARAGRRCGRVAGCAKGRRRGHPFRRRKTGGGF